MQDRKMANPPSVDIDRQNTQYSVLALLIYIYLYGPPLHNNRAAKQHSDWEGKREE